MRHLFFAALLVLACAGSSAAQSQDNWQNLSRIRAGRTIVVVDMKLKKITGKFVRTSESDLVLRVADDEQTILREQVYRVSVRSGLKRVRNTLIGFGAGAAIGAVIGAASYSGDDESTVTTVGMLIGMGAGAGGGAAVPGHDTVYRAVKPTKP